MQENPDKQDREELKAWIKQQLDDAVWGLMDKGALESLLVEAKPAWVFPYQVLIGKVREQGQPTAFDWFICGEVPTDLVDSENASTPRDAARYFAMKWQLEAARQESLAEKTPTEQAPESPNAGVVTLADKAEALYALVDDAEIWQQQSGINKQQ